MIIDLFDGCNFLKAWGHPPQGLRTPPSWLEETSLMAWGNLPYGLRKDPLSNTFCSFVGLCKHCRRRKYISTPTTFAREQTIHQYFNKTLQFTLPKLFFRTTKVNFYCNMAKFIFLNMIFAWFTEWNFYNI